MKTHDMQWFDLFQARGTRRDFLRLSGSVASLLAVGALPGCSGRPRVRVLSDPFTLGVASGDPAADGVVLWTRIARNALGGLADGEDIPVTWEIADDEAFSRVVQSGTAAARPAFGDSVHVEASGLDPTRGYFYRMLVGGEASPVGRTKTAPAAGAAVDRLHFAFTSCQHYEQGLYTALGHMANEDVDFVVHLGDYIYEYAEHDRDAVRHHTGPEIVTLDHYRDRYSQYRSDPALQAAHAIAPWILTPDDHEVDNNWAGVHPEDDQPAETLMLRRAAAFQAYYEFMPLRTTSIPAGPDMQLYRRLRFGGLMEMNVLDTRQYRSDQPCGDRTQPTCTEHTADEQTILGSAQRRWLFDGLANADARWNVLAQQVMVARLRGQNDQGEETWSMDKWDGYPKERMAMLDHIVTTGVDNPVVLTGDIHSNWVADLKRDFDDPTSPTVATEYVGTSISSGGDGQDMSPGGESMLSNNPHIAFYNGQRGYQLATVTPDLWTTEYKVVPFVTRPGAAIGSRATFVTEAGSPGAQEG